MTTLEITAKVSKTTVSTDAGVNVATITPTNDWTLWLRIWSFTGVSNNTNRARINFEDSVTAFATDTSADTLQGPTHCIVPAINNPEGRVFTTRWRDFDDFRIGISSAEVRTNLTRITGGTIVYEAWLTY